MKEKNKQSLRQSVADQRTASDHAGSPDKVGTDDLSSETVIDDGFFSVREAAEFLHISRASIYSLMEQGLIAFCKFGKTRRIPRRPATAAL
jgi:excisionase family DNA binding protein